LNNFSTFFRALDSWSFEAVDLCCMDAYMLSSDLFHKSWCLTMCRC
jgi:hypothetical protein